MSAAAGYSGTPLARKLGIREGHRVTAFHPPAHFRGLLHLPTGARYAEGDWGAAGIEVALLFVRDLEVLEHDFSRAAALLTPAGGLWVGWPKRSSPLAGPVKEADVRRTGLAAGLVDNKICAIDADWSGLRFVVRVRDRSGG